MKFQKPLTVLAVLVVLAGYAVLIVSNLSGQQTIHEQNGIIGTFVNNTDALRDQVKSLGQTPVAPPADSVTDDAPRVAQNGTNGANGTNGQDGRSVETISCEATGEWFLTFDQPPLTETVNGPCIAQNGTNGTNGTDGADSTLPGPPGADGRDGRDGDSGEPPFSWTQPGLLGPELCTRTDPFDKNAPTYNCTPTTP